MPNKKSEKPLEWNVFYENVNESRIRTYNVLNGGFLTDCQKAAKKFYDDFEGFSEEIRRSLMYYYWCKCEWEVIIRPLFIRSEKEESKVDVYSQVMLNWDHFISYLWIRKDELKKIRKQK